MNLTFPINRHARELARKPAVISAGGVLSYAELDALLWRTVGYLRDQGLRKGDTVGLAVQQPLLHLLAALALARMGVAYHAIPWDERPSTISAMQRAFEARAVVRSARIKGLDEPQIPISGDRIRASTSAAPGDFADHPRGLWRFAKSSGTTGRPKLFAISYANLATMMARYRMAVPICGSDVSLVLVHLAFLAATRRIIQDLLAGASVVLLNSTDAAPVAQTIASAGVSRLYAGPWLLPKFLEIPELDPSFRKIAILESSGSIISGSLRREVIDRYTSGLVVNYGTNEVHPISSAIGAACLAAPDTVGWPVARGEVQIVDEKRQPVGVGVVGRIRAKDTDMIASYWNDEAATRAAFVDGWFYPGDLGVWSETGQLLFKGRADDMIILDGINIFPVEIENCLMLHPAVTEAVAFGLTHPVHGGIPVAAVRASAPIQDGELEGFCQERIGVRYPRRVLVVADLPRNVRGKPDKMAIVRMLRIADQP